ncbi:MAG: response regulator transcription factor [Propionibacteriaceae bacterium]|jgi:DNA-binding response OmpR family regulator|nr:response regulator transcription factor [Propionibacteriaceae bacterium]
MEAPLVLIVDDEAALARVVASYCEREGWRVALAHDGPTAVASARQLDPQVIILDVMLPGFDGYEVCRQVRSFSSAQILMLTARGEEPEAVAGLTAGADDYMVKPVRPFELMARVKARLRRDPVASGTAPTAEAGRPELVWRDWRLDPESRRVWWSGHELELTPTEFDLIAIMLRKPHSAWGRRQLLDRLGLVAVEHSIDVHVGNIRAKLAAWTDRPVIRTVRGVGYGLAE